MMLQEPKLCKTGMGEEARRDSPSVPSYSCFFSLCCLLVSEEQQFPPGLGVITLSVADARESERETPPPPPREKDEHLSSATTENERRGESKAKMRRRSLPTRSSLRGRCSTSRKANNTERNKTQKKKKKAAGILIALTSWILLLPSLVYTRSLLPYTFFFGSVTPYPSGRLRWSSWKGSTK
jgi:hypothetical protein